MRIKDLIRNSVLLFPLIALQESKLYAEQSSVNSNEASVNLRDNFDPSFITSSIADLLNCKTDPGIIDSQERNYTKEKLRKEIKDVWYGYRWYRNGKIHLSNADQIEYAHNHADMTLEKYRRLFVRYENDNDETFLGKICRAYIPPNPNGKPMFVLTLGHAQKLTDTPDDTGIIAIYDRLVREKKGIILMFMTGSVLDEIDNVLAMKSRFTEHEVMFAHMERNIKDFVNQYNPSELRFAGFSWGGGAIVKLSKSNWWQNNVPVKSTVFIDAITLGGRNLGIACRERPYFNGSPNHHHYNIYQRQEGIHPIRVQGDYPTRTKYWNKIPIGSERDWHEGDVNWRVLNVAHNSLDDLPDVKECAYRYLLKD